LGFAYEHGLGVAADPAEAKRWYRLASEHRDTDPDADARHPLDEIACLTLIKVDASANHRSAVVRNLDGKIRTLAVGDMLGTQHGKFERIDDDGIELTEVLPNGYGGAVEKILRMRVDYPAPR